MIMKIKIGDKLIGKGCPYFVIAEAGVNHNGRLDLALKLIDAASDAGADAIKFQTFKAEGVVIARGKAKPHFEMLKKLELKEKFYKPIIRQCKQKNIIFLSTPHSPDAIDFLESLVPAYKIGSGDLTNLPFLEKVAKKKKPIILSTGMATMKEVKEAMGCIKKTGNNKIIALHCTTNYPCSFNEVNLRAMQTMMKKLDVLVGYSDHTLGIDISAMAVTLGACVIEKHFTLDRNMTGPDHKASIEPDELGKMIKQIRNVEEILGSAIKKPNKSEIPMIKATRKSIVSLRNIKKGEKFTKDNIGIKRPGAGLAPKYYFKIVGKKAKKNIKADKLIKKSDYA